MWNGEGLHRPKSYHGRYHDSSKEKCNECGSRQIVYDKETDEHICCDCGLILLVEKMQTEFIFR